MKVIRPYISILIALMLLPYWTFSAVLNADFSRYSVILARKPFGMPSAKLDSRAVAKVAPVAPRDSFVKYISMIAITDDELGTRVGLYDKKSKRSYFIEVGQLSEDGIRLLEADFKEGGALLRKDGETVKIFIDGKVEMQDGTIVNNTSALSATPVIPSMTGSKTGTGGKALSYVERLRLRRAQQRKVDAVRIEEAARRKIADADKEKMLRSYNMELIRAKGKKGKPLPMVLTAEEDAQLVNEGVLPPRGEK